MCTRGPATIPRNADHDAVGHDRHRRPLRERPLLRVEQQDPGPASAAAPQLVTDLDGAVASHDSRPARPGSDAPPARR